MLISFLLGLGGFCLVSSAVYTLNDLFDAAADRHHPSKRNRPIAAGIVAVPAAVVQVAVLLVVGLALCLPREKRESFLSCSATSLSTWSITSGQSMSPCWTSLCCPPAFVIRVLLGCALVSAHPSAWLLLCTSSLALFLGFAKRRADLAEGLDHKPSPQLDGATACSFWTRRWPSVRA